MTPRALAALALLGLLCLACGTPEEPPPPSAAPEPAAAEPVDHELSDLRQQVDRLKLALETNEDRLARVELTLAELQERGVDALQVKYDPRATTFSARNLQEAMDEMAISVNKLQALREHPGQPGPGLFEIPRDGEDPNRHREEGPKNPPGGQDHNGGAKGPPPPGGAPPSEPGR